jgi:hypothetical protein
MSAVKVQSLHISFVILVPETSASRRRFCRIAGLQYCIWVSELTIRGAGFIASRALYGKRRSTQLSTASLLRISYLVKVHDFYSTTVLAPKSGKSGRSGRPGSLAAHLYRKTLVHLGVEDHRLHHYIFTSLFIRILLAASPRLKAQLHSISTVPYSTMPNGRVPPPPTPRHSNGPKLPPTEATSSALGPMEGCAAKSSVVVGVLHGGMAVPDAKVLPDTGISLLGKAKSGFPPLKHSGVLQQKQDDIITKADMAPVKTRWAFLRFFAVKEPSTQAFLEYQDRTRKQQRMSQDRESSRAGLPMMSSAKLPPSVPKVNSKWRGAPQTARQKDKERERRPRQEHGEDGNLDKSWCSSYSHGSGTGLTHQSTSVYQSGGPNVKSTSRLAACAPAPSILGPGMPKPHQAPHPQLQLKTVSKLELPKPSNSP